MNGAFGENVSTGNWPGVRPPSSAYCCHRSASISSAAARNLRMATSPLVGGGAADSLLSLRALAPITAAPVARAPRRKERRFLNCFELLSFMFLLESLRVLCALFQCAVLRLWSCWNRVNKL